VPIEQKQLVFYSHDYAKRARCERAKAVEKAKKLIKNSGNGKLPAKVHLNILCLHLVI